MRRAWSGAGAVALVLSGIALFGSCAAPQRSVRDERDRKAQEILMYLGQIRDARRDLKLPPEPARFLTTLPDPPPWHPPLRQLSEQCDDTCGLARYICDAKDKICRIADELGPDDWAHEKCQNARGSCREAQKRCDTCR